MRIRNQENGNSGELAYKIREEKKASLRTSIASLEALIAGETHEGLKLARQGQLNGLRKDLDALE